MSTSPISARPAGSNFSAARRARSLVFAQQTGLGTMIGLPPSFLDWNWLALFPMFIVFFISALAETNRPPFDLPEAESELVAGFMVEYGSTPYMMFMLGEYAAIVLMCALTTTLFLGGWLPILDVAVLNWIPGVIWFLIKVCLAIKDEDNFQLDYICSLPRFGSVFARND